MHYTLITNGMPPIGQSAGFFWCFAYFILGTKLPACLNQRRQEIEVNEFIVPNSGIKYKCASLLAR